jgi:hypothetical protein
MRKQRGGRKGLAQKHSLAMARPGTSIRAECSETLAALVVLLKDFLLKTQPQGKELEKNQSCLPFFFPCGGVLPLHLKN